MGKQYRWHLFVFLRWELGHSHGDRREGGGCEIVVPRGLLAIRMKVLQRKAAPPVSENTRDLDDGHAVCQAGEPRPS